MTSFRVDPAGAAAELGASQAARGLIEFRRASFVRIISVIALLLVCASLVVEFTKYFTGHDRIYGLLRLFAVDREGNIPTLFSVVLLLIAAGLAAIHSRLAPHERLHWHVLAVGFVFLAIDEGAMIHELLNAPLNALLPGAGPKFFVKWILLGIAGVALVGAWFTPFLLRLPRPTLVGFLLAAVLYVGGSIGMEWLGSYFFQPRAAQQGALYIATCTVEETLEIVGVIVFIHTLLKSIDSYSPTGKWRVETM